MIGPREAVGGNGREPRRPGGSGSVCGTGVQVISEQIHAQRGGRGCTEGLLLADTLLQNGFGFINKENTGHCPTRGRAAKNTRGRAHTYACFMQIATRAQRYSSNTHPRIGWLRVNVVGALPGYREHLLGVA